MRKNWKRATALGMAAVMTAGMLTGCGGGDDKKSNSGSSNAVKEDGTLDTSEEVELVMYVISDRPAGQDAVDENLNKLLKEKLNCTLKINWIGWAEYANKYPLLFSSGESFDMAYSATWLNFASLAQKGAFMNLDEMWPKFAPKNFERQSDAAKSQATVNGHYYCVPTLKATYNAYGVMYRNDLVEGTDWDGKMENLLDVEEYCDIIKEKYPEMEPIDQYSAGPEWSMSFMQNNGMRYIDNGARYLWFDPKEENPKVIPSYEYEKMPEFLEMMARWNEKGFFSKSALADTDSMKTQNGKAAVKLHNIDTYASLAVNKPEWDFKFANLVSDVAHLPFTQDCMVISNTAKNPERAMALWDLITSDQEVFDAFFYGIKDTTYTLNDKGQFKITDPDLYGTNAMWAARTNEFDRESEGTPDDYTPQKEAFEASITPGQGNEKFSAFVLDTSKIETEYSACTNVQQQYWWPLELGYTDKEAGLAEYEAKMKAAGIEKVMEEAQRQLDEFVASQK